MQTRWFIVSLSVRPRPDCHAGRRPKGDSIPGHRESGALEKSLSETRARPIFETQPTKAHHARAWVAKPTGVKTASAVFDSAGLPKGRRLTRDHRRARTRNSHPSACSFRSPRKLHARARRRPSRRTPPRKLSPQGRTKRTEHSARPQSPAGESHQEMKPANVTSTRTTRVRASRPRVKRVRARLRQLHRKRPASNARTK